MAKCCICGKIRNTAIKYRYRGSYVTKRTLRVQKPNIKKIKMFNKSVSKRVPSCTKCIKLGRITRVKIQKDIKF